MQSLSLPKEAWVFSNLNKVVETLACTELCTTIGCLEAALPVVSGPQYVFHNGALAENLSGSAILAHGATLHSEAETSNDELRIPNDDSLDQLDKIPTTANQTHTLTLSGKGTLPLHLIHVASGDPSTSRYAIHVADGAEYTLIEHHVAAPHFTTWQNVSVSITLGKGAKLTHCILQTLPPTCVLTRRCHVDVADGASYTATTLQAGATFSRMETHATLATACHFANTGLSLARRSQHHGNLFIVRHVGEGNSTSIRQRNLADDAAHAVFQGKFHVEQSAQKTDAYMHCHNLLLNDAARASHKPELEIYADDVKCSHGAATGGLNANQLFYLEARGLPPQQAQALLTEGFAQEFIAEFPEPLHPNLAKALQDWQTNTVNTEDPTPDLGMAPIRRETDAPLSTESVYEDINA